MAMRDRKENKPNCLVLMLFGVRENRKLTISQIQFEHDPVRNQKDKKYIKFSALGLPQDIKLFSASNSIGRVLL